MSDTNTSTAPAPATTWATIRVALVALGGFAAGKGWIDQGSVEGIVTAVLAIGSAGWGLYQTYKRQTGIKKAEQVLGTSVKAL